MLTGPGLFLRIDNVKENNGERIINLSEVTAYDKVKHFDPKSDPDPNPNPNPNPNANRKTTASLR